MIVINVHCLPNHRGNNVWISCSIRYIHGDSRKYLNNLKLMLSLVASSSPQSPLVWIVTSHGALQIYLSHSWLVAIHLPVFHHISHRNSVPGCYSNCGLVSRKNPVLALHWWAHVMLQVWSPELTYHSSLCSVPSNCSLATSRIPNKLSSRLIWKHKI